MPAPLAHALAHPLVNQRNELAHGRRVRAYAVDRECPGDRQPARFGAFMTEFGPMSGLICGENSIPFAIFALVAEGTRVHVMS
ncbi:MAG: hypothetical protein IRY89_16150 [Pseudolabrys sp.]|nr:hypothetical protein [Pseudolabrys sp.]